MNRKIELLFIEEIDGIKIFHEPCGLKPYITVQEVAVIGIIVNGHETLEEAKNFIASLRGRRCKCPCGCKEVCDRRGKCPVCYNQGCRKGNNV